MLASPTCTIVICVFPGSEIHPFVTFYNLNALVLFWTCEVFLAWPLFEEVDITNQAKLGCIPVHRWVTGSTNGHEWALDSAKFRFETMSR